MPISTFIGVTFGMMTVTFLIRFSMIGMAGHVELSEGFKSGLKFIPVTVLPAIIATSVFTFSEGQFDIESSMPKVIASIICIITSRRFGLLPTVVMGMVSLTAMNAWF